ncbi:hypothetical protein [Paraburkholderia acidipaludis]|uniref:hypothetical protein n=1 Tax=Paraburkholderia acidipaludis TaxID=660537 RepID=UPI000ABF2F99|nr:hypothetical protein [Paraburkholderia acidipaludis]
MNTDHRHDQTRAIREDHEKRPAARNETPREARWRREREEAAARAKAKPHEGY